MLVRNASMFDRSDKPKRTNAVRPSDGLERRTRLADFRWSNHDNEPAPAAIERRLDRLEKSAVGIARHVLGKLATRQNHLRRAIDPDLPRIDPVHRETWSTPFNLGSRTVDFRRRNLTAGVACLDTKPDHCHQRR